MRRHTKKLISYAVSVIVIIAAALWVGSKLIHPGNVEFTDNAQIEQQIVPVNSRVQGFIKEIRFKDFQKVKKGDTLIIIDDTDLKIQLSRAEADYRNALAAKETANLGVGVANANEAVTKASIEEARVLMENAKSDYERYQHLYEKEAVTRQQYERALTDYKASVALYQTLKQNVAASASVVAQSNQSISQNEAGIEIAESLVAAARQNLSYCVIIAPCSGYISRKKIQEGQLIQPGQTLIEIVDNGDIWIEANFKETQLAHIKEGSTVKIKVDAIPGIIYHGRVVSISRATGSSISIIPQDNSSGNFVKVRQRIPVRINFTDNNSTGDIEKLRAGMNVECEVIH